MHFLLLLFKHTTKKIVNCNIFLVHSIFIKIICKFQSKSMYNETESHEVIYFVSFRVF